MKGGQILEEWNEAFNRRTKANIKAFGMEMYKLKSSNTAKCSDATKQDAD